MLNYFAVYLLQKDKEVSVGFIVMIIFPFLWLVNGWRKLMI